MLSWFSNPVPRPVAVHCQCSEPTLEPLLVDQPRSHDVPTLGDGVRGGNFESVGTARVTVLPESMYGHCTFFMDIGPSCSPVTLI